MSQTRVAYGGAGTANDWGTWCGACHADFNVAGGDDEHHPTGESLGTGPLGSSTGSEATNYNAYISSGILTGDPAKAYNTLVPFAEATSDLAVLASHAKIDDSFLNGPGTGAEVMCLSCHRAHASGFMEDLRWDYGYEFMTKARPVHRLRQPGDRHHRSRPPAVARPHERLVAAGLLRPGRLHALRPLRPGALQQVPRPGLA